MPRTVSVDNLVVGRIALVRDAAGQVDVYCEYVTRAGAQIVQVRSEPLAAAHVRTRQALLRALFDAVTQDLAATELT